MKKQIRAMTLALLFALSLLPAAGFAADPDFAEVATYDELVAQLAASKNVKLTDDVVAPDKDTLTIKNQILDLGGKTLTLNGESGSITGGTIQNGTIKVTTYAGDTVADGLFDVKGDSTVTNVVFTSEKFALYALFDLKVGNLAMTDCAFNMSNNEVGGNGGLFYTNGGGKLTMKNCTADCTDIGDFIVNGEAELVNCEFKFKGAVADGLDNVINGAALTLDGTTLAVDGATGRGLTTDGDPIVIKGGSVVTLTNCTEADILYKATADVTVEGNSKLEAGSVVVDSGKTANVVVEKNSAANLGTSVPDSVTVKDENGATIEPAQDGTYGEYVAPVVAAPAYAGPVMNWVKVNSAENGVVKSGPLAASAGATITLYPKAAEGYVLDTVTVLDASGNALELDGLKFQIPAGGATVSATFKLAE